MTNSVRYLVETVEWSSSAPWKISRRWPQGSSRVMDDGAVDLDGLCLVVGEVAVGDAVLGEGGADAVEGDLVAHLPAHGVEVVLLGAAQGDAAGALVEAQVEGVVVAAGAHAQVEDVVGEGAPAVEVGGVDSEVAEGPDVAHGVSFRR